MPPTASVDVDVNGRGRARQGPGADRSPTGALMLLKPQGWDPVGDLPPGLPSLYAQRAAVAVHFVCQATLDQYRRLFSGKRRRRRAAYAAINADRMRRLCVEPWAWNRAKKHLVDSGVLEVRQSYSVGKSSTRYTLGPGWINKPLERYAVEDATLARKLAAINEEHTGSQPPEVRMLEAASKGVTIDVEHEAVRAATLLATPEGRRGTRRRGKKDVMKAINLSVLIERVNGGERGFRRCGYGRCHSAFTQIPREIRKRALRWNGERMTAEADVSACQPLLIGQLAALDRLGVLPVEEQRKLGDVRKRDGGNSDGRENQDSASAARTRHRPDTAQTPYPGRPLTGGMDPQTVPPIML